MPSVDLTDVRHERAGGTRGRIRTARQRLLALLASSLLAVLICGPGALAQQSPANVNAASGQRVTETALIRAAASSFGVADLIAGGCALSGGRERACWTEIGTPVSKRVVADSLLATIQ